MHWFAVAQSIAEHMQFAGAGRFTTAVSEATTVYLYRFFGLATFVLKDL